MTSPSNDPNASTNDVAIVVRLPHDLRDMVGANAARGVDVVQATGQASLHRNPRGDVTVGG